MTQYDLDIFDEEMRYAAFPFSNDPMVIGIDRKCRADTLDYLQKKTARLRIKDAETRVNAIRSALGLI